MRIALVNSSYRRVVSSPPLGLLSIAATMVSAGHDVRVYDIFPEEEDRTARKIESFRPEVIGFSVSTFQFQSSKRLVEKLRKKLKKTFFAGGGVHISSIPEYSLRNLKLDCCIVGEGEITFRELCDALSSGKNWSRIDGLAYIKKGIFFLNRPRALVENLDALPFPARYLLPMEKYLLPGGTVRGKWSDRTITMMTSRGCPGRCIFCASKIIFGRRMRRRSVENVMDELKTLKNKYRITAVYFSDDTFTLDRKWVTEFCEKMVSEGLSLEWACQARIGTVDGELIKKMKGAGLAQLEFGIESGSKKILEVIKKDVQLSDVEKTIRVAKKLGVRTLVTFILGMPYESMNDVSDTIELARKINADHYEFYFAEPFPGTELLSIARELNLLLPETVPEDGLYPNAMKTDFREIRPSMMSDLDIEQLVSVRNKINKEFPRFALRERLFYLSNLLLFFAKNPSIFFEAITRGTKGLKQNMIHLIEGGIRDEIG